MIIDFSPSLTHASITYKLPKILYNDILNRMTIKEIASDNRFLITYFLIIFEIKHRDWNMYKLNQIQFHFSNNALTFLFLWWFSDYKILFITLLENTNIFYCTCYDPISKTKDFLNRFHYFGNFVKFFFWEKLL